MAAPLVDSRTLDLAEELIGDMEGATETDIWNLASDFQDAFEDAANRIEERTAKEA